MIPSSKIPDFDLATDKITFADIDYEEAGSFGRKFKQLRYLVMHYTAGRGFNQTVARFKDPANKVSAHLVVGRRGEVVQMVALNRPAWHAGADSRWTDEDGTFQGTNFYSLGVEFENYGPLRKVGGKFLTWFGRSVPAAEVAEVEPGSEGAFGVRHWHVYSALQISIAEALSVSLVRSFALKAILGHSDVSPGRKTDPGPLFPMKHLRAIAFGRADEEPEEPTT